MSGTPHFLAVGAVTADRTPLGLVPGGTTFYAAQTARALGVSVAALTNLRTDLNVQDALSSIGIRAGGTANLTFANIYGPQGREQRVEGNAPLLTPAILPPEWREARAVLLGPVWGEVAPSLAQCFPTAKLAVTPQGWMRRAGPYGRVERTAWSPLADLLDRADAVILSEEDLGGDQGAEADLARRCRLLVVTRGERGCTVYQSGRRGDVPGFPVTAIDPTGAGDVFAAAFLLQLTESDIPLQAARFANAVASCSVQARGAAGLPNLAQVRARLALQEDPHDAGATAH
ncbi:MAG: PfkB family carbohydrate kinase [Chloroflexi bacterium]|nr:PfkB family carbohydrate kinase [Chloroflexota bacterium]